VRLAYPAGRGKIILRSEYDWEKDIEPVMLSEDGNALTFELGANKPFLYFKPCLIDEYGNENTLATYALAFLQYGQNLIFLKKYFWGKHGMYVIQYRYLVQ
jgi:hypothetical protein